MGSSANGFGTNLSDVDICLMVSHEEINQKTEAICLLKLIARAMRKAGNFNLFNKNNLNLKLIYAFFSIH